MKYFNYKTYNFNKFFRKLNFRKYDFLETHENITKTIRKRLGNQYKIIENVDTE